MLTIRKIRVASGDRNDARRTATYLLEATDSPAAFTTTEGHSGDTTTAWLGSPRMLDELGVEPDAQVSLPQLALALQGCNAVTGERIRREGWIERHVVVARGRRERDEQGRPRKERVLGTKSVDLTFSAPKSVSVVWSQAGRELRTALQSAMIDAAAAMLEHMTRTKPVVAHQRSLWPARGHAAAAALHAVARTAQRDFAPSPQLHVHGVVLGVERADGLFAAPELSGLFKHGAPLEGGAAARAKLAERLVDMGFELEGETGQGARFFEIRHVPPVLVERMSGRTSDVAAGMRRREAAKGRPLTNGERSVIALETRKPKSSETSPAQTAAVWRAQAEEFDFGPTTIEALRQGPGFAESLDERASAVRSAVIQRIRRRGPGVSVGEARGTVFESAAGRLRLDEASVLLDEMDRCGELRSGESER